MKNKTTQIKLRRADRMRRAIHNHKKSVLAAKSVCFFIVMIILGLLVSSAVVNFNLHQSNYDAENVCIAHWVSQGIERADIIRVNGQCFIKGIE